VVRKSWSIPLVAVAILVAAVSLPIGGWGYDLAIIVLVFPALLYLAASADFGVQNATVRFLADISYPVYAVHLPLIMAMSGVLKKSIHHGDHPPVAVYLAALPIILFAWAVGRWYELPTRLWLSQRLLTKPPKPALQAGQAAR